MSWLRSITADLDLPEGKNFDIQVCLEELMSNIVRHGQSDGPGTSPPSDPAAPLSISITVDIHADSVIMTLEDNGRPFDITKAPVKAIEGSLDKLEPGGLGIEFVKSFTTDLQYRRTEMGNRVTMQFSV